MGKTLPQPYQHVFLNGELSLCDKYLVAMQFNICLTLKMFYFTENVSIWKHLYIDSMLYCNSMSLISTTHFQSCFKSSTAGFDTRLITNCTDLYRHINACVKGHLVPTHLKSSPLFTFSTKLLGQDSPSVHLFSITIRSRFTAAKIKLVKIH